MTSSARPIASRISGQGKCHAPCDEGSGVAAIRSMARATGRSGTVETQLMPADVGEGAGAFHNGSSATRSIGTIAGAKVRPTIALLRRLSNTGNAARRAKSASAVNKERLM